MHTRMMAGLELRAGAELDATEATFLVRKPLEGDVALSLSGDAVAQALAKAIAKAREAGFTFAGPTVFAASARLTRLIETSEALNQ